MPTKFLSTPIKLLTVTVLMLLLTGVGYAGSISVAWDPVSHPELLGYRVYHGTGSENYSQSVDVGNQTHKQLTGLADCTTHYVVVRARGADDLLSPEFSNQIAGWPVPRVDGINASEAEAGTQLQLVIEGANFQPDATLTFSDPAITVNAVAVPGCYSMVATISIGIAANLGPTGFEVVNPDQSFVVANGLLHINEAVEEVDEEEPVISSLEAGVVGSTMATITWATDEPADGRVSYRKEGESTYQQTAPGTESMTDHAIALHGLRPDTAYEFYVTSSDGAGNLATSPVVEFTTLTNAFTYIRFEAEAVTPEAPFEIGDGGGSFGEAWLMLAPGTSTGYHNSPAGTHDLGFHLADAGSYHFWYRMYAADRDHDGWLEEVDGAGFDYIYPDQEGIWLWVEGRSFSLEAGQHTLTLGGHEAEARIDRILITNDAGFAPSEEPGSDSTPPGAVTELEGEASDGVNDLSWVNPSGGDLADVVVRYRTDGVFPTSPVDGQLLFEGPAQSGATGSFQHSGLANGSTYSYAVFVTDTAENCSAGRSIALTPNAPWVPLGVVGNLRRTDLKH